MLGLSSLQQLCWAGEKGKEQRFEFFHSKLPPTSFWGKHFLYNTGLRLSVPPAFWPTQKDPKEVQITESRAHLLIRLMSFGLSYGLTRISARGGLIYVVLFATKAKLLLDAAMRLNGRKQFQRDFFQK